MTEITRMQVDSIIAMMRNAGFDVTRATYPGAESAFALTCPPRSRLMFGAVIASVIPAANVLAHEMLLAGCTSRGRGRGGPHAGTTLYFPGFTEAG